MIYFLFFLKVFHNNWVGPILGNLAHSLKSPVKTKRLRLMYRYFNTYVRTEYALTTLAEPCFPPQIILKF